MMNDHIHISYPLSIAHITYRSPYRYPIDVRSPISIAYIDLPIISCHSATSARQGARCSASHLSSFSWCPPSARGLTLVHIFAQPEPFLSLKPAAKHPTTWDKKCSRCAEEWTSVSPSLSGACTNVVLVPRRAVLPRPLHHLQVPVCRVATTHDPMSI